MGLPEGEKERIRAEEIYRAEIQRELQPPAPHSRRARLMHFLNTSLGLWILSSLFLSGLVAGFGHLQAYLGRVEQRRTAIEKLTSQIAIRWGYASELLQNAKALNAGPMPSSNATHAYLVVVDTLLDDSSDTRVSSEFRDRSTLSLVLELQTLDPGSSSYYRTTAGYIIDLMRIRQDIVDGRFNSMSREQQKSALASVETTMAKMGKD